MEKVFHECQGLKDLKVPDEDMEDEIGVFGVGPAIFSIDRTEGGWVAHNGEYSSVISFCPFCGKRLD